MAKYISWTKFKRLYKKDILFLVKNGKEGFLCPDCNLFNSRADYNKIDTLDPMCAYCGKTITDITQM